PTSAGSMIGLLKLVAAAAFVLVLWLLISGAFVLPAAKQEPPIPPAPIPKSAALTTTPTTPTAPATAADVAKLNDTIAKLTMAVERINLQLAASDLSAKPNQSPPTTSSLRREEIDARQISRRQRWRDSGCWW